MNGINGGSKSRGQMPALEAKYMLQEKHKSQEIYSLLVVGGGNVAEDEQHVAGGSGGRGLLQREMEEA